MIVDRLLDDVEIETIKSFAKQVFGDDRADANTKLLAEMVLDLCYHIRRQARGPDDSLEVYCRAMGLGTSQDKGWTDFTTRLHILKPPDPEPEP